MQGTTEDSKKMYNMEIKTWFYLLTHLQDAVYCKHIETIFTEYHNVSARFLQIYHKSGPAPLKKQIYNSDVSACLTTC